MKALASAKAQDEDLERRHSVPDQMKEEEEPSTSIVQQIRKRIRLSKDKEVFSKLLPPPP